MTSWLVKLLRISTVITFGAIAGGITSNLTNNKTNNQKIRLTLTEEELDFEENTEKVEIIPKQNTVITETRSDTEKKIKQSRPNYCQKLKLITGKDLKKPRKCWEELRELRGEMYLSFG